jgi:hypothetical protein
MSWSAVELGRESGFLGRLSSLGWKEFSPLSTKPVNLSSRNFS